MEALLAAELPEGDRWQYEPKWDGFRCIARRDGEQIDMMSRSGKPLGRYFPEVLEILGGVKEQRFVVDGELILPLADRLDFEALQMRLHPAESRIRKLARETPAQLVLFDVLEIGGESFDEKPLGERRKLLERFHQANAVDGLLLSPATTDRKIALAWLKRSGGALDGVVAKRLDQPYRFGERAMVKVKQLRTADCVVGGFRYAEKSRAKGARRTGEHGPREVGSLLLGLYDEQGVLHHVGFTSAIPARERPELTEKLEELIQPPGFTGNAPGGPSRWATERSMAWEPLRPELVVEVRYDQVTGRRFRHGTALLRWRPDKAPRQCTFEQLAPELRPSEIAELFGA
jgi:ATP-dependent DNA ligase